MSLPPTQRAAFLLGPEKIEIREIALPPPAAGEIVVRVEAALTCGTDLKVFLHGGHPRMLQVPCRFGHEVAGIVAAGGSGTGNWHEGERVVVANSASCGACRSCSEGRENLCENLVYLNGAFAEYLTVPALFARRSTYPSPAGLPTEWAALAEPLACVLHGLEICRLAPGTEVAVLGAGPIGLLFVAALAGRGHRVLLADPHAGRLQTGSKLGAAATLLASRTPGFAAELRQAATDRGFDAVIDATGSPQGWSAAVGALRAGGVACAFAGPAPGTEVRLDLHALHYGERTLRGAYHHRPANFAAALALLAARAFDAAVLLDGERSLDEVEPALRVMQRREALKVIIRP